MTASTPACPLCGAGHFTDLGAHPDLPPDGRIVRCGACAHGYAVPVPDPAALAERYRSQYRSFRKEVPDLAYMDFMNLRAAAQIAFLRTGLPDDWAPARVLDVGCSAGSMLVALSATAGRLTGYEPDVQMARFAAHRLPTADIRATVCDPADLPAGEFDLITMSHVLEHVPTPVEFVRGLLRALAPGGRLFVEVPNEVPDELDALIRYGYRGHVHLSFFTPPTLVRCVEAAGGRVLRLRTAGPSFRDGSPVTELVRATATSRPKRPLIIRAARLLARPVSRGLRFRSAPPIPAPHPWNTLFAKESTDPAERIWVRALIEVSE